MKFVVIVFAVLCVVAVQGRYLSRQKRVSDQRLAEIETLLALSKYRGMLSTVPVGYGRVDPNKLGRRRRAANLLWRELLDSDDAADSDTEDDVIGLLGDADEDVAVKSKQTYGEEYTLVKDRRRFDEPKGWGAPVTT